MCTCFWQGCAVEIGIWEKFMIAGVGVGRTFYKILLAIEVFNFFQFFYKFYKNQKNIQKMIANCVETPTAANLQRLSSTGDN